MNKICICGHEQDHHHYGKYHLSTQPAFESWGSCFKCNCRYFRAAEEETTPAPQSWATELEKLALTEPDPNKAVYNLPQLKAFIAEQIARAEKRRIKEYEEYVLPAAISVAEEKEHGVTLRTVRERIELRKIKFAPMVTGKQVNEMLDNLIQELEQ